MVMPMFLLSAVCRRVTCPGKWICEIVWLPVSGNEVVLPRQLHFSASMSLWWQAKTHRRQNGMHKMCGQAPEEI